MDTTCVGIEFEDVRSPTIFVWYISSSKCVGIEFGDVWSPIICLFSDIYVHDDMLVLSPEMLNLQTIFCLICALYNMYDFFLLHVVMDQSWINTSRISDVYEKGVEEFLKFAKWNGT